MSLRGLFFYCNFMEYFNIVLRIIKYNNKRCILILNNQEDIMEIKAFIFVVLVLVLTAGMKIKEIATAIKRGGHVYLGLNLPFLVKVVCLVMIIADIVG
jgi:hypothetical protein